ncbi:MAG: polyprenyl synthetase family protein [Porticoccus sp.]|nr:polyprenyl synthetase family protein [Porticoccus sp.]|tara:strand:+ start:101 stop:994 length:894 start_codon:yes stop_codon:yes gene_type:complete
MGNENFADFHQRCQQRINQKLEALLPETDGSCGQLHQALRYSVLNGGKRIRPLLSYAAAEALGGINQDTDIVASSVELIHAYSLIHDDLPAMDNDDLRRGKPTCHIAFDEATAILAGDALQSLAFQQLTELEQTSPKISLQLIACLAKAAGAQGMVAGQAIDIASVNQTLTIEQLEHMHHQKTGAMILASITMGALSTGNTTALQLSALEIYGRAIGLAFQVQDDILDVVSDTEVLGKQQGADKALNKPTYTALLGLDGAKQKTIQLHQIALSALSVFGHSASQLRAVADYIVNRDY